MKKRKNKRYVDPVGFIVLVLFFIFIIWFILFIKIANINRLAMNDFCNMKGFGKATDSGSGLGGFAIECDGKKIFYVSVFTKCIDMDKWGNCKAYSNYYLDR